MASIFEFQLEGKSYSVMLFFAEPEHFYVLDDGSLLPISVWPAWCESCQRCVAGERILSIEEEDKQLEEFEYFAQHPGHIPPDRSVSLWNLPELRVRKKWRRSRTSPAKCLVCGSAFIISTCPNLEAEIPGRGKCVGHFSGWADACRDGGPSKELFTPEGDRISSKLRDLKPGGNK